MNKAFKYEIIITNSSEYYNCRFAMLFTKDPDEEDYIPIGHPVTIEFARQLVDYLNYTMDELVARRNANWGDV